MIEARLDFTTRCDAVQKLSLQICDQYLAFPESGKFLHHLKF